MTRAASRSSACSGWRRAASQTSASVERPPAPRGVERGPAGDRVDVALGEGEARRQRRRELRRLPARRPTRVEHVDPAPGALLVARRRAASTTYASQSRARPAAPRRPAARPAALQPSSGTRLGRHHRDGRRPAAPAASARPPGRCGPTGTSPARSAASTATPRRPTPEGPWSSTMPPRRRLQVARPAPCRCRRAAPAPAPAAASGIGRPPSSRSRAVGVSRSGAGRAGARLEHAAARRAGRASSIAAGAAMRERLEHEPQQRRPRRSAARRRRARSRAGSRTADRRPPTRPRRRRAPRRSSGRGQPTRRDERIASAACVRASSARTPRCASAPGSGRAPTAATIWSTSAAAACVAGRAPVQTRLQPLEVGAERERRAPRGRARSLSAGAHGATSIGAAGPATLPARSDDLGGAGRGRRRDRQLDLGGGDERHRRRAQALPADEHLDVRRRVRRVERRPARPAASGAAGPGDDRARRSARCCRGPSGSPPSVAVTSSRRAPGARSARGSVERDGPGRRLRRGHRRHRPSRRRPGRIGGLAGERERRPGREPLDRHEQHVAEAARAAGSTERRRGPMRRRDDDAALARRAARRRGSTASRRRRG